MDRRRTAWQEAGAAGVFDARAEAALPVRVAEGTRVASGQSRAKRSWLGIGLRIVRDAAVAVAFMTLVPVAIVGFNGANTWGRGNFGNNIRAKLALLDVYRPLMLPRDPSINPMQAGVAFNALQPWADARAFTLIEPKEKPAHSWETAVLTEDMFVNGTMNFGWHGPSSSVILERAAKGFTPKEAAYLRALATAPVWRDFDLVARAPAVDIIGGSFKLPFPADAHLDQMPTSYKATRELAYASVSRAAYHLSIGQRDSAEAALLSIISFGYAMIDNGNTAMDEMVGNIIVAIGRDGLGRFYVLTNDPRAGSAMLTPPAKVQNSPDGRRSIDQMRKLLIAETANPKEHLGIRYEALRLLSAASCTNVKELMFGNGSDVDAAIQGARANLARYPSERALVDLVTQLRQPRVEELKYDPIQALAVSSATVAGAVLGNPRLAACTRIVTGYYGGPW
ncbi:MAG: hypothetical protein ABI664_14735 [bacterium]